MLACAGLPVYRGWGRVYPWLAVSVAGLGLLGCIGSNTRGAWIAIPLLLLVNAVHLLRTRIIGRKQLALGVAALLAAAILALPFTRVVWQTRGALEEIGAYQHGRMGAAASGMGASVSVRFEQWRAAWQLFKANRVLGVGPGMYLTRVTELNAVTPRYDANALKFSHPHSEYVFVMATLGALGLLALALLWLLPLVLFARAWLRGDATTQSIAVAGMVLVAGYAQFGLTESLMFQHATFLGFYLLTVAVLVALLEQASQNGRREKPA
jgi:O-antigen ligase